MLVHNLVVDSLFDVNVLGFLSVNVVVVAIEAVEDDV